MTLIEGLNRFLFRLNRYRGVLEIVTVVNKADFIDFPEKKVLLRLPRRRFGLQGRVPP